MMDSPFFIKKIAVLGAGVMGAQIAAHCVNAGIETLLFDLPAKEGRANGLVEKAIHNLTRLKPSPLALPETAQLLQAKNYEDNIAELHNCDLIIEAIGERRDWKESLYKRIAPHINNKAVLVSNTSGLSINTLAEYLPSELRSRFCGLHFFNPPRYMHLAELIPSKLTSDVLFDKLETWLTSSLGKGVVRARDTPNFIANRIGVFSLLATLHHASTMHIDLDVADALTGVLLGRPKSATFRTMDVVGLDTMQHVVQTMHDELSADPWHALFQLPEWMRKLIANGDLGQKTGQGVYRKQGKIIEVFDLNTGDYKPATGVINDAVKQIFNLKDSHQLMEALMSSDDPQARFLAACYRDLFHYCAYHLESIANNVRDVDLAVRWGFGWQQGPFETWQGAGVSVLTRDINAAIQAGTSLCAAQLPAWLQDEHCFYTEEGAFSPADRGFVPRSSLPVYQRQFFPDPVCGERRKKPEILYENPGVSLTRLQHDIAVLSFRSKANTIGQSVLEGMEAALDIAEQQTQGVIIYQNNAENFSSGADLLGVASLIKTGKLQAVENMIAAFQKLMMRMKYLPIPVTAALRGRALGGGCELILHCDAVIAGFESWPGLVELGVGLIPGGGGCKEMALRAAKLCGNADLMLFLQPFFQQIATAVVAGSAVHARQLGYLRAQDSWVMHRNEVLYAALFKTQSLLAGNYKPPLAMRFQVAGREGQARIRAVLINWLEGGFISQYDYVLADHLAHVLCGGEVNAGEMVNEQWMLNLEKQAFMALAANPLTQARIVHLLETGRPLRN